MHPDNFVTRAQLLAQSDVDIGGGDPRFEEPLAATARVIAERYEDVVLLGSIASQKYTRVLLDVFGDKLRFPSDFVGRGDMSRGGLLLRAVRANTELPYVAVRGAILDGPRPPRLTRQPRENPSARPRRDPSPTRGGGPRRGPRA